MRIDKKTYAISEVNRYKTTLPKTQIVIGTSLRKSNYHIKRLQHKEHGESKAWNTYTISREGKVYQHFDDKYHSDFIGVKEGDKNAISIVLENMGNLMMNDDGVYVNYLNEICAEENVTYHEYYGAYDYWEDFPDEQIDSLIILCKRLCKKYNIPTTLIEFNTYHKDVHKFRGIAFKSNYIDESTDMNPLLDISVLNSMLNT